MNYKHLTNMLLTAGFIFCFSQAQAQISVGIKAGANLSNLNGLEMEDVETKAKVGFHGGAFVTFNLGRNFALQPELLYSSQGTTLEAFGEEEDLKLNYVNIPIAVKFLTNSGFYFEAGPQIGFRVGDVTIDDEDISEDFNNSDFSILAGLGFQPTKSPIGIGLRYNVGVSKVADVEDVDLGDTDFKNGVWQLSLYWRIFGGGKLKE